MPVLRLFAGAREAAGVARVDVDGATVGEMLDHARARFGDRFVAVLDRSRIWVNGQPAGGDTPVQGRDVVAVIPPVSGGADDRARPPAGGGRSTTGLLERDRPARPSAPGPPSAGSTPAPARSPAAPSPARPAPSADPPPITRRPPPPPDPRAPRAPGANGSGSVTRPP
ncbi:MAG: MoaD/ThiS family protein, partial [Actinomycetota bacterium]|nr:MoaD/ThiS family protein [Actinomycetota bacterium]